jgi:hypothetical protein
MIIITKKKLNEWRRKIRFIQQITQNITSQPLYLHHYSSNVQNPQDPQAHTQNT